MGYAERENQARREADAATAAADSVSLTGLRVALDVQHIYRTGIYANDRGCRFKLAGGLTVWESQAATAYAAAAAAWLRARGADVVTNDPAHQVLIGPYSRRNLYASARGVAAYLACHVNAGGGSYCSMGTFGLARAGTLLLATEIAGAVRDAIPALAGSTFPLLKRGDRGAVCIERTYPAVATVLCEPVFGDNPRLQDALTGPGAVRLGEAIASGVAEWWVASQAPAAGAVPPGR
jgi:N-acetylmuramoyl-L-alanine amidase